MTKLQASLTEFLVKYLPFKPDTGWVLDTFVDVIMLLGLFLLTWGVYVFFHFVIARYLTSLFRKTENTWDDEFINSRIIKRIARFIPATILWKWTPEILRNESASNLARGIFTVLLIIIGLTVLYSAVNTFQRLYQRRDISKQVPINGITQTIKIILTIGASILILSALIGKSPTLIFSGFGALTAILMLVFKDPILGLTAGIQLSSNRLIAVGDWIEVPKYKADGTVLEMGLTTVKVQNWDKTITTIPTYSLISESFKNWQGMSESGLRRIKRSLLIDVNTVRFLTPVELETLQNNRLIMDYLSAKHLEMTEQDARFPHSERRLTNIGTFRAYIYAYLHAHGYISPAGTQLVRQLQPTAQGIPLEVYCFSSDNNWVSYENIQSDLFDHLISILPTFHLRLFQEPSGGDFQQL